MIGSIQPLTSFIVPQGGRPATGGKSPAGVPSGGEETGSLRGGDAVSGALEGALRSHMALPSFLYPSVTATAAEKALIFQTLDQLPMKDVGAAPAIRVLPSLDFMHQGPGTILGVTVGSGDIGLSREGIARVAGGVNGDDLLRYTLIHEAGHARDLHGGLLKTFLFRDSHRGPWGKGPFVTDYAESAPVEDYAEGHAFYHMKPDELARADVGGRTDDLKSFSPQKWEAMHADERPNFMERIVEQKPFRETGRLIGEWTSNQVGAALHTGLGIVSLASMVNLVVAGAKETVEAGLRPSGAGLAKGLLTLGAGASLAFGFAHPVLGPASLALLGARRGMELAERQAAATPGSPAPGASLAGAAGGAVGGVVGGVLGPLGGTLAGYELAGPVGGAVGLIIGSLAGFRGGSTLGAKAALAVQEHLPG